MNILIYAHEHWQDNILASAIWAVPGYIWGRLHFRRIHRHLHEQDARHTMLNKHVKEIHKKVHQK